MKSRSDGSYRLPGNRFRQSTFGTAPCDCPPTDRGSGASGGYDARGSTRRARLGRTSILSMQSCLHRLIRSGLPVCSFVWMVLAILIGSSRALAQGPADDRIRIACVGDSITEGHLAKHEAWPLLLERLIDQKARGRYAIGNFGKGGATLLRGSATPYWATGQFKASQNYQPDIVVINLGVNDAHHGFWQGDREEFQTGLIQLIGVYQSLASQPKVYLSTLTTMYPTWPQWESAVDNIITANQVIRDVGELKGLEVIDLATPTGGNPGLFPDGLHPNKSGNWLIAKAVFQALEGKDIIAVNPDEVVFLEAEAFEDLGGWAHETQFMHTMGSPILTAHGLGRPVKDARTTVRFPQSGQWRVWVRTRDWTRAFGRAESPGRFELRLAGVPIETVFGTEQADWHWQDGGIVTVEREMALSLHDLSGFNGRCDAIVFLKDVFAEPPGERKLLAEFRRQALRLPREPYDEGRFDLVVVGGGLAGTSAAIAAARQGLMVALIDDRPMLGGNLSPEVRFPARGDTHQAPYPQLGDLVRELVPQGAQATPGAWLEHDRWLQLARKEPGLRVFLQESLHSVELSNDTVIALRTQDTRTAELSRFRGRWYADCTVDGELGFQAGADWQWQEKGRRGSSNLWSVESILLEGEEVFQEDGRVLTKQEARERALFLPTPWALNLSERPFPNRTMGSTDPDGKAAFLRWFGSELWQSGFDLHTITDRERIRDHNLRAMFGAWDAYKNVEKRGAYLRLEWAALVLGVRESRQLLGDVVLQAEDFHKANLYEDAAFPCTWPLEDFRPDPAFSEGLAGQEFLAEALRGQQQQYTAPYWVPYRTLYSRNLKNLFMAGSNISVTHEAQGAIAAELTGGLMGEVVGLAATICSNRECSPREVYREHWDDLQELLLRGVGR